MRLAGREDERVARCDWSRSVLVPHNAPAGDHVIELPLHAVRVVWKRRRSRGQSCNLDVERVAFHQIGGLGVAPQGLRELDARSPEFSLWGRPLELFDISGVDFAHGPIVLPDKGGPFWS